jgi:hypothetical protein
MLFLFVGQDSYRRSIKKKEWMAAFAAKYPDCLASVFDVSDASTEEEARVFCAASPLFSSLRMAVLENCEAGGDFTDEIIARCSASQTVHAVAVFEKNPGKKVANQAKEVYEFALPKDLEWGQYVEVEAKRFGLKTTDPRVVLASNNWNLSPWGLSTELAKIAMGASQKEERVVDVRAFAYGRLSDRLSQMQISFSGGSPWQMIFYTTAAMTGKQNTPLFAEYDAAIKSGKIDYEEALLDFAVS